MKKIQIKAEKYRDVLGESSASVRAAVAVAKRDGRKKSLL
jgi:hypothetical protein